MNITTNTKTNTTSKTDNPVEEITKNLANINKDISKLEGDFHKRYSYTEKRYYALARADLKIDKLLAFQNDDNKIYINSGEVEFITAQSTIINCMYDNILKQMLLDKLNNNKSDNENANSLFVDIEPNIFEAILEIIRYSQIDSEIDLTLKEFELAHKKTKKAIRIYEPQRGKDSESLVETIKTFFKNEEDINKILHTFKLVYEKEKEKEEKIDKNIKGFSKASRKNQKTYI